MLTGCMPSHAGDVVLQPGPLGLSDGDSMKSCSTCEMNEDAVRCSDADSDADSDAADGGTPANITRMVDATVEAAVRAGVSHRRVSTAIRDGYVRASTPYAKVPVLFCTQHGGFGYSRAFLHFLGVRACYSRHCYHDVLAFGRLLRWGSTEVRAGADVSQRDILRCVTQTSRGYYGESLGTSTDACLDEQVGLRYAAGQFCTLAVKWAPRLVDYRTVEYDGLEDVTW